MVVDIKLVLALQEAVDNSSYHLAGNSSCNTAAALEYSYP